MLKLKFTRFHYINLYFGKFIRLIVVVALFKYIDKSTSFSYRCPDTSGGVYALNTNAQTTNTHPATNPTLYMAKTPGFLAFKIPDYNGIDITCIVLFCASGTACDVSLHASRTRVRTINKPTRNNTLSHQLYITKTNTMIKP